MRSKNASVGQQHYPTVTVGIPAHNEEANIKQLLLSILSQHEIGFTLDAVYVVFDGSTDHTANEARSVMNDRVHFIANKSRMGQAYAQNLIFEIAKSDVVVILEADTNPRDMNYLTNLIEPIVANDQVGLVQGNSTPLPGQTTLGDILKSQIDIYHTASINDRGVRDWITSGRGGRAFTQNVYTTMRWPNAVPEDSYALLWCRTHGIPTIFQESAVCYFRCSETFSDFLKERAKVSSAKKALEHYFPKNDVQKIFTRPLYLRVRMLSKLVFYHPFHSICYLFLDFILLFFNGENQFSDFWEATVSTKKL